MKNKMDATRLIQVSIHMINLELKFNVSMILSTHQIIVIFHFYLKDYFLIYNNILFQIKQYLKVEHI